VHAFAVTLATFLVCAGFGSGVAAKAEDAWRGASEPWFGRLAWMALLVAVLAVAHALVGPWLLAQGLQFAAVPRAALAVVWVAPLAFVMGLPFPLALARLRAVAPALVPWAWGVNGCASVVAAALAGVLAMSLGSRTTILLGAAAYAVAAGVQRGLPGRMAAG
jgi:hypothetical protein